MNLKELETSPNSHSSDALTKLIASLNATISAVKTGTPLLGKGPLNKDEEGRPGLHRDTEHPLLDCKLLFQVCLEGQSLSTFLCCGINPPLDHKDLLSNHLAVLQIEISAHEHTYALVYNTLLFSRAAYWAHRTINETNTIGEWTSLSSYGADVLLKASTGEK